MIRSTSPAAGLAAATSADSVGLYKRLCLIQPLTPQQMAKVLKPLKLPRGTKTEFVAIAQQQLVASAFARLSVAIANTGMSPRFTGPKTYKPSDDWGNGRRYHSPRTATGILSR